jgi:flagellar L-ring protein precursor FlgH
MIVVLLASVGAPARDKKLQSETLAEYLRRMQLPAAGASATTTGSLWRDDGRLVRMAADYKAAQVGDLLTILVAQDLSATSAGNVATDRSLKASSGIDALAGGVDVSDMQNLLSLHSSQTLAGKAQATSQSSLRTRLAGRVAAVLPEGTLVVEAERQITMNNERQTILLRGLVRPGDIAPDNSVSSNAIGNLELELKGKGVISDGTRPPTPVTRILLHILGF